MNSIKIESNAVDTLKNAVNKHKLMKEDIKSEDRNPSWDGEICLYKSEDLQVEDIEHVIPVQVKGKNDNALLKRKIISYPVEYKHLRNYYNDGGVFYVVVVLSDDLEEKMIFYNSLTTIKLADILKGKEDKKPEQTKNIPLQRLENNSSEDLFKILMQLGNDMKKQGSGDGEIIKKAINIDDMNKVDKIKVTSCLATCDSEVFKEIETGAISLYGHRTDLDMWVPFDYTHQKEIRFKSYLEVDKCLGTSEKTFYNKYIVEEQPTEDSNPIIKVSANLSIDFNLKTFSFSPKGTIEDLVNDIDFINSLSEGAELYIDADKLTEVYNVNVPKSLRDKMQMILDIDGAFKELGIRCDKRVKDFSEDNWQSVNQLLNVYHRRIKPQKGNESAWYMWYWDEKIIPIFLGYRENNIEVVNWFTTRKYCIFVEKDKQYPLPNFILFKRDIFEKLYDVYEDMWIKEIEKIKDIKAVIPELFVCFIELLSAYDVNHNENYFKASEKIVDRVLEVEPDDEYAVINKLQLVKRKGFLQEKDIIKLEKIEADTNDDIVKCAVNILIDNKRMAQKLISLLPIEQQNLIKSYPIYNLL